MSEQQLYNTVTTFERIVRIPDDRIKFIKKITFNYTDKTFTFDKKPIYTFTIAKLCIKDKPDDNSIFVKSIDLKKMNFSFMNIF